MLRVFKDLNIIYYIVSSGIGVVLALLLIAMEVNEIVAILIIALWIFGNAVLFQNIANKRAASIGSLRDQCRLKPFIEEYKKLLSKQKPGSLGDAMVRLNLSAGLLDSGQVQEALNIMRNVRLPKSGFGGISKGVAAVYHNNYSLAFLKSGEIELAKEALKSSRTVIEDPKFPERERGKFRKFCDMRDAQIDIVSANTEGLPKAEMAFKNYFNHGTSRLEKAAGAYWLARICYMKGDREEEKKYLAISRDQGGDTVYSREAENILMRYHQEEIQQLQEEMPYQQEEEKPMIDWQEEALTGYKEEEDEII